jgi:preprotein translocase subunit SecG
VLTIVTILHILVCFALVLIVLLQAGKGAEMGAAFGGASQTIFGSSGAMGFLTKLTTVAAVIFMITSLLLAFSSSRRASSVVKERPAQTVPAEPAAPEKAPLLPQAPVPEPKK